MSQPLFTLEGANDCSMPLLEDFLQWKEFDLEFSLNFRSLASLRDKLVFKFDAEATGEIKPVPDISPSYVSGMLLFRSTLMPALFPAPCPDLEFLPIRVAGEDWRLLNCLKTTKGYDAEASKFFRGETGQIFFVQHLVVTDPTVAGCELFTLEDSNRAQLYCLPAFKERIEALGLKGLKFREIGYYEPA